MSERRRPPYLAAMLFVLLGASLWLRPTPPDAKAPPRIAPAPEPPAAATVEAPPQPPKTEAGAAPAKTDVLPAPKPETPESPTVELRGRVVDARLAPAPFVRIEAFTRGPLGNVQRSEGESDAEGAYSLKLPAWSEVVLTAKAPGSGRGFARVTSTEAKSPNFTLQLRAPYAASGTAAYPGGAPLAGATLRFHPMSQDYTDGQKSGTLNILFGQWPPDVAWDERCRRELFLTDAEVVTDAAGGFKAPELIGGINYVVEVAGSGILIPLRTRGLKGGFTLEVPR